jgi:hypothetical protein
MYPVGECRNFNETALFASNVRRGPLLDAWLERDAAEVASLTRRHIAKTLGDLKDQRIPSAAQLRSIYLSRALISRRSVNFSGTPASRQRCATRAPISI